ncbi:MAG: hypothetical protein M3094_02755, partial [Actinomycetia bacterium]|nr:hypothetical protein [Actinomycetes bacterium]
MKRNPDQRVFDDGLEEGSLSVVRIVDDTAAFDGIWAAFSELFGEPTSSGRSNRAKIVHELDGRGATGAEVMHR